MNNVIKWCLNEIHNYNNGNNELKEGISVDIIERFERKYNIQLPSDYKFFLSIYNGGTLFYTGTSLASVYDEECGIEVRCGNYLHLNLKNKWPDMGDELLIIADLNFGDMICLDMERNVIVQWDHEIGEEVYEWNSFSDWLRDELESGKEFINCE